MLHLYEPVPQYYQNLQQVWSGHVKTNQWAVEVHNYGLGDSNRTILLSEDDLKGQGTFGMENSDSENEKKVELDIREVTTVVNNVIGGAEQLDLLHVNCEGCEYEMLENIIHSNLHQKIK